MGGGGGGGGLHFLMHWNAVGSQACHSAIFLVPGCISCIMTSVKHLCGDYVAESGQINYCFLHLQKLKLILNCCLNIIVVF